MPNDLIVRVAVSRDAIRAIDLPGTLRALEAEAGPAFAARRSEPGTHLLLGGDRGYYVTLRQPIAPESITALRERAGKMVYVLFPGRTPVRRVLRELAVVDAVPAGEGVRLGDALWLLEGGTFATRPGPSPSGIAAREALVAAARWVSMRRTSSFERLFPPSAFHPDQAPRPERLSVAQAAGLLAQLRGAIAAAAVGSAEAKRDPPAAAQLRSAAATVLSHVVATANKDPGFRAPADDAAAALFALVDAEVGDTARPALRAHVINLLSLRGPALRPDDKKRAQALLRGLVREKPPYDQLAGAWRFAMCSDMEFHEGEIEILARTFNFKEVPAPSGAPSPPAGCGSAAYHVFEAPFKNPNGQPIQIFARAAQPKNENHEMADAFFIGLLINRHAQLGAFDMRAATVEVKQAGYKLMVNTQCAGLTTRYAISRMFPDADIYSSWDSTYFNTDRSTGKVSASEGLDCFIALLEGMARGETFAKIDGRMREAQWHHDQASAVDGYLQFIGPANPLVVSRFSDVNQDGRADLYDGFLDFQLRAIAEEVRASATPRDPGAPPSQISGEAANGLNWAAGSLDRVAQYSDIWAGLPGASEQLYAFQSGGFYNHKEPPADVDVGSSPAQDLGKLPSVCRYVKTDRVVGGLMVEVMLHSHLAHAAKEFKRLVCAAEALNRAFDTGNLPKTGVLATRLGQRGTVLLTLAGLLEYPADTNSLDALWSAALKLLNLPDISRSVVRACITNEDHDASNYYGSYRGLRQLIGDGNAKGDLERADAVAFAKLKSDDPMIGRASELAL